MEILTRGDVQTLLGGKGDPMVSIFLPTIGRGKQKEQNHIRFRNLVAQVESQLVRRGIRAEEAPVLAPARRLLSDESFWNHQSDGLAIFLSPGFFRYYRLPFKFDETVVVGDRFYIKPLLPLVVYNGRFYVLAVSQSQIRLLQCTRYGVTRIPLRSVPANMEEALRDHEQEKHLNYFTATAQQAMRGGHASSVIHGQGGANDGRVRKKNIRLFLEMVDSELSEVLGKDPSPVVPAGDVYIVSQLKEVSGHLHLTAAAINESPNELTDRELQERGCMIACSGFRRALYDGLEQYARLCGTDRVSDDVRDIVPACRQGRVERLFAAIDAPLTGAVDDITGRVEVGETGIAAEDLVEDAIVHALLHQAAVYPLSRDQMPGKVFLAAVFRY
jgi:hypothetical protein